jgi:hypothetical protein
LVFPRHRFLMGDWLQRCTQLPLIQVVPAHFEAPVAANAASLRALAEAWQRGDNPSGAADRRLLRQFNRRLEQLGLVPMLES